jgi:transcriptional regulator with XRE-family HTH domain
MNRRTKERTPEWSASIERFRHALKLSQHELGKRLNTSAMAISRWKSGNAEPAADAYIKLGNLAGNPLCWDFWGRAGLRVTHFRRALSGADRRIAPKYPPLVVAHAGAKRTKTERAGDFVAVPLHSVYAATPGAQGDREADLAISRPERLLAAPIEWCPHPEATVCMRVKGDSMSPFILDGYIIAVDTSDIRHDSLAGASVLARHRHNGLLVSRLIRFDPTYALYLTDTNTLPSR